MKKINKKGVTLMELVVSIAMLSVAMVLLYSLMSNIQAKKKVVTRKTDDMIKVAEIETVLQKEIAGEYNYGREKVKCVSHTKEDYSYGYPGKNRLVWIVKRLDATQPTRYEVNLESGGVIFKVNGAVKHKWKLSLNRCTISPPGDNHHYVEANYNGRNGRIFIDYIQCDSGDAMTDNYEFVKDIIKLPMAFNGPNVDNCETY